MNMIVHKIETDFGTKFLLQEGRKFTEVEPTGVELGGLFSEGGFFDNAIKTASGIFKKKDGSPTFVGETVQDVSKTFAENLAQQLAAQGQQGAFHQAINPSFQLPQAQTSQLPQNDGSNPLDKKDNTPMIVIGTLAVLATGTAIYFATKKKKS